MRAAIVRATELIASLREKNARLRAEVRDLKGENAALASQVETLQARLDKLRSTPERPVEGALRQQERAAEEAGHRAQARPAARRRRGTAAPSAPGSGRRRNRATRLRKRVCVRRCGKPYAANGERCTTLFEIDVEAYENTIVRSRWRRSCDCASAPREVTAPAGDAAVRDQRPTGSAYGTCMLYERFVCCRSPASGRGLAGRHGAGDLARGPWPTASSASCRCSNRWPRRSSRTRTRPALRHADETSWRVQGVSRGKGRSSRAWLWISGQQRCRLLPHRPLAQRRGRDEAVRFGQGYRGPWSATGFSAYRKLARELAGKVILQWCWAHQRRSFIDRAAGHVRLRRWCQRWIERIALIYRLKRCAAGALRPPLTLSNDSRRRSTSRTPG